jgi:hypothetical protein
MAPRPNWKGFLKLSLVSCSISLYPATSAGERVSFNQINKNTGNRVRYKKVDGDTGAFALLVWEAWMPNDPKTNEWNLLKQQFDALLHDENVSPDSIEEVLDVEFRRRFAELIYRATYRGRRYGVDAA